MTDMFAARLVLDQFLFMKQKGSVIGVKVYTLRHDRMKVV